MADPFRVQCAHCKKALVVQLDVPRPGDAVQCPECGLLSLVLAVQDNRRVQVKQLEVDTKQSIAN